ncbi:Ovarian cancer-associated protein 2 [Coemansia sp. RSA 2703]|nr:Ovarian cancer-associated protein 2 [Coemansia sp. RSA 2703]
MGLRILCLHGYTQSGPSFRARTGPLRRGLGKQIEWVYATAPHLAATTFDSQATDAPSEPMAWWNMHGGDTKRVWADVEDSVKALQKVAADEGPFDGVLGFSQGAGMAAVMLALGQKQESGIPRFKFAVLISGFYPQMQAFEEALGGSRMQVPSLHVLGAADAVVPKTRGEELAQRAFENAEVHVHEGGHYVPANAEWRRVYKEFIERNTAV